MKNPYLQILSPLTIGQASGPQTSLGTLLHSVDLESFLFSWVDVRYGRQIAISEKFHAGFVQQVLIRLLCW